MDLGQLDSIDGKANLLLFPSFSIQVRYRPGHQRPALVPVLGRRDDTRRLRERQDELVLEDDLGRRGVVVRHQRRRAHGELEGEGDARGR